MHTATDYARFRVAYRRQSIEESEKKKEKTKKHKTRRGLVISNARRLLYGFCY